jgi:hypothetical protein
MITTLNIFLFLLASGILIILGFFSLKIKNKHYKLEILETKNKAIQKRITKEQSEWNELKERLEEQKVVLNKKWDQIQNDYKNLEEKALKIENERRQFSEEKSKVSSQKIEIEQEQLKIEKIIKNFKDNLQQEKNEIIDVKQKLAAEQKKINFTKEYLESTESKLKIDYHKVEKEKDYLSAQFKELEVSKRNLEILNKKLLEKEKQLEENDKKFIEEKIKIDREKEKINNERRKIDEQKIELAAIREKLEREKQKLKNEKNELEKLKNKSELKIVFQKPDGDETTREPKSSRFRLEGNIIRDDNGGIGPLFGKELPKIIDHQLWNDIDVIVIGEEGEGHGELRWKFKPEINSQQLDLNQVEQQGKIAILSESKKSWFFIRFYDNNDELIDRLDFRFIRGLNTVDVAEHPYLPGSDGHQSVKIEFLHAKSCAIKLSNNQNNEVIIIRNETSTNAIIPPDPKWDVTEWQIIDHLKKKIIIKIFLNRIWWIIANESGKINKSDATDKIVEIPFDKVKATSRLGINFWLPKRHEIQQISFGFDIYNRKFFKVRRNDEKLFIPLREFIDYNKLQNLKDEHQIKLWLDEATSECIPVMVILPPWLFCKVKNCNFKTTERDEMIIHIKDKHFHHFFTELNYEQIRLKYNPELPVQIYQCGYCNAYVNADNNHENPTNAIINHIEQCPKAMKKDGAVHIQFRIVKDSNEIRKNVIKDLPYVFKCGLCDKYFKNQKIEELIRHLISGHESEL